MWGTHPPLSSWRVAIIPHPLGPPLGPQVKAGFTHHSKLCWDVASKACCAHSMVVKVSEQVSASTRIDPISIKSKLTKVCPYDCKHNILKQAKLAISIYWLPRWVDRWVYWRVRRARAWPPRVVHRTPQSLQWAMLPMWTTETDVVQAREACCGHFTAVEARWRRKSIHPHQDVTPTLTPIPIKSKAWPYELQRSQHSNQSVLWVLAKIMWEVSASSAIPSLVTLIAS